MVSIDNWKTYDIEPFISFKSLIIPIKIKVKQFKHICDIIKRNESDVGDVVFELLAKTVFKFLCYILFLALSNPS